jgi:hypothetical protein
LTIAEQLLFEAHRPAARFGPKRNTKMGFGDGLSLSPREGKQYSFPTFGGNRKQRIQKKKKNIYNDNVKANTKILIFEKHFHGFHIFLIRKFMKMFCKN